MSIINLLLGQTAAHFRLRAADIVVRALGGDETLVAEIRANAAAVSEGSNKRITSHGSRIP